MKQEFKEALDYLKATWPLVKWKIDHDGESCYINGRFSQAVEFQLWIRPIGCMAKIKVSARGLGGVILHSSQNKHGINWKQAVDEITPYIEELSKSLAPAKAQDIYHVFMVDYYQEKNESTLWNSYTELKDAIEGAIHSAKMQFPQPGSCWSFNIMGGVLNRHLSSDGHLPQLYAVIQMDESILFQYGSDPILEGAEDDPDRFTIPAYAKNPPSVLD
jgi:hypothetical protein